MPIYAIDDLVPVVHPSAFVHPSAELIGDVWVGEGVYVGPCASLRGDFGRLVLEAGSNLQDHCTMHGFPGADTVVEAGGHIGHGAVLHGCRIGRDALVGMNAVVMDNAIVGEGAFVAALCFVRAGFEVPPRHLIAGVPGKVVRELTPAELAWKSAGTATYQRLTVRCRESLQEVMPLASADFARPRLDSEVLAPLKQSR
ncbi:phenylacetic acid degradation protein PaaY [Methylibium sp.]|uniref:phenylacetic acid degradation protein PaaY n=1 Tax=Methylibium sp. TaxID=2067992 RepID=UPI00286A5993|nr:phenylacetic acid degradation protein PaaY [Methylibium sp.]